MREEKRKTQQKQYIGRGTEREISVLSCFSKLRYLNIDSASCTQYSLLGWSQEDTLTACIHT